MTRSYTTASTQNSPRTWRYTAVGGETTLSGVDGFSTTLSYAVGGEQLFVNGVLLERGVDYTATNGTSVTLSNALVVGDLVTINSQNTFAIANALPLATVQNKGDLIVGTASGAVTNLGVGADGTTLVANSSAGAGVSWTGNQAAGRNAIINGAFDIAQRGTSFTSLNGVYNFDRWSSYSAGSGTLTQDTTYVPTGIRYAAKFTTSASNSQLIMYQTIETANAIQFAGKTVTLSLWIAGTAGQTLAINLGYSTGVDTAWTGSFTPITYTGTAPITTTTPTRYQYQIAIPSNAQTLQVSINTGTIATSGNFVAITGVQLEQGAAATTFTRAGGTLQGELAACQRYYYRHATGLYGSVGTSFYYSSSLLYAIVKLPVTMRNSPTIDQVTGTAYYNNNYNSTNNNLSSLSIDQASNNSVECYNNTQASGTAGMAGNLRVNSSSAYLGFSAEL